MDADLDLSVEEANSGWFVLFVVEELEVDIPEVHDDEVYVGFVVLPELPEHLLLVFSLGLQASLAELDLLVEVGRQILYFLYLSPHSHLDHHQLVLLDHQLFVVGVQ